MNKDNEGSLSGDAGGAVRSRATIPNFELLRQIGIGAYGEVWLARGVLGDYVALKVVYRDRFSDERPYLREYEGIRRFRHVSRIHPSQLTVLHVGQGPGFFYYTMELADDANAGAASRQAVVEGANEQNSSGRVDPHLDWERYKPRTLRSLLRTGVNAREDGYGGNGGNGGNGGAGGGQGDGSRCALPVSQCLEIGMALASALECLHGARLVHRDIKPSNIVFVNGRPKLADIGLVAGLDEARSVVGTEGYMAPEGPGQVQADVFALGRVLYEMVTGLDAKEAPTLPEGWATRPDRKDLHAVNEVVLWACDGNLARRYKNARALREDLESLQAKRSLRYRKLRRAIRQIALVSAFVVPLLIVGGYAVGVSRTQAIEQRRREELAQSEFQRRVSVHDLIAGWFTNRWVHLGQVAPIRMGDDVLERATALIAGLDARCLVRLEGRTAAYAAFSTNGICLVKESGRDGTALLIGPEGVTNWLRAMGEGPVGWSADGAPLQFVQRADRAVLYDLSTGLARREFPLPDTGEAQALAMAPDGSWVAVALAERVLVWDGLTGMALGELPRSADTLAFSPDGAQLALGESEGYTRVYRMPGCEPLADLPPPTAGNRITCLAFGRNPVVRRRDSRPANPWVLATGDRGGGIVIWDLDQKLPKSFCRGSTWTVSALAFDPDGLTLASAGRNEPRLWDVATGEVLLLLEAYGAGEARTLAFDRTGRRLVCGGERGVTYSGSEGPSIDLRELEPHHGIESLRGLTRAARRVWFSGDSQRVAALSDDWHLAVWDLVRQRLLHIFETAKGIYADNAGGCFDPRGDRFAFATWNEACVYDLDTGAVVSQWTLPKGLADQLEYDAEGRLLLVRRERPSEVPDEKLRVWRLRELGAARDPVLLHEQTETNWWAEGLLFQPGGKRFAVWNGGNVGTNRAVRIIQVSDGHEVWRRETALFKGDLRMCFDPGGKWFGCPADLPSPQGFIDMEGLREMTSSKHGFEAISPSAKDFAGNSLGVPWLQRDGVAPVPLVAEGSQLGWVTAFSPDGKLLAWGTEEGLVHVAHIAEVVRRLAELDPRGTRAP